MTLREYIGLLAIGSITAIAAWLLVLFFFDPVQSGMISIVAFYLSLFIAIIGVATSIGTSLRVVRFPKRDIADIVHISLRQAILFAVLIESALYLVRLEALRWWIFLIVLFILSFVEYLFLLKQAKK